jgi:hypothetical protein
MRFGMIAEFERIAGDLEREIETEQMPALQAPADGWAGFCAKARHKDRAGRGAGGNDISNVGRVHRHPHFTLSPPHFRRHALHAM